MKMRLKSDLLNADGTTFAKVGQDVRVVFGMGTIDKHLLCEVWDTLTYIPSESLEVI